MNFKAEMLFVYFLSAINAIKCVNIVKLKEMNQYRNFSGIGPPCDDSIRFATKCTLDNGEKGVCSEVCKTSETTDAEICCHARFPSLLRVYYCCEVGVNLARGVAIGGERTEDDEFPYMAALGWYSKLKRYTYDYKCGGAFISYTFVLTAAHCAYINGIEPIVVLPGGINLTTNDDDNVPFVIETVYVHPDYDDDFAYNDIALIQTIDEHEGAIIALWQQGDNAYSSFTAVGYGDTTLGGTSSDVLLKVVLKHVATENCQRFYSELDNVPDGITNTQLCAMDPENKMDTCQGDSGGPLIMSTYNKNGGEKKEYLVGITSFAIGCASSAPGVYTRVTAYTKWINDTIGPWLSNYDYS